MLENCQLQIRTMTTGHCFYHASLLLKKMNNEYMSTILYRLLIITFQHPDLYSRTKSEAEQKVMAANCSQLRTCALRLAGVYGPEDQRHTPRIVVSNRVWTCDMY